MAINQVSASTPSVTAPQALRPQQDTTAVQRQRQETQNEGNIKQPEVVAPPKPTVNTSGQTVGTLVNVTA